MQKAKAAQGRTNEILDTAERLFLEKGYTKTTIVDILQEIGIAKGTFYYYFQSKEELMDAIVMRSIEHDMAVAKKVITNAGLTAHEKFFLILMVQRPKKNGRLALADGETQANNPEIEQKRLAASILYLSPLLGMVVRQGVDDGLFSLSDPEEAIEFLLASMTVIFDNALIQWKPEALKKRAAAFIRILEVTLGAESGSFAQMERLLLE